MKYFLVVLLRAVHLYQLCEVCVRALRSLRAPSLRALMFLIYNNFDFTFAVFCGFGSITSDF